MREVVIVSAVRTPIGSFGGSLKDVSAVRLGAIAAKEAMNRANVKPEMIEEVIIWLCTSSKPWTKRSKTGIR